MIRTMHCFFSARQFQILPAGAATLLIASAMMSAGCRLPNILTDRNSPPDIDRLIELEEQANEEFRADSSLASRLRPGAKRSNSDMRRALNTLDPVQTAASEVPADSEDDLEFEQAIASAPSHVRDMLLLQRQALRQLPVGTSSTTDKRRVSSTESGANRIEPSNETSNKASQEYDSEGGVSFSLSDADDTASAKSSSVRNASHGQPSHAAPNAKPTTSTPVQPAAVALPIDATASNAAFASLETKPRTDAGLLTKSQVASETESAHLRDTNWEALVREAIAKLSDLSGNEPTRSPEELVHRSVAKRMLSLSLGEMDTAMEPIPELQPHEQQYFQHQFQALHDAINLEGNPVHSRRWTLAMQNQRMAHAHLAAVSNLEIHNASFCTVVDSFGVTTPFPKYQFRPDQELLLYLELDNFVSESTANGYETQLQGSYEIVASDGKRVADQLLPLDSHTCRSQRRDYFIAYHIYMPQNITPGSYHFKLTMEDVKSRKFGQTSIDFTIVP